MKSGVSEIIGQAVFGDGSQGMAYRALRPLVCATCGGVIAAEAMFTRDRQSAGQRLRLWPRCQACLPFALARSAKPRSALLESLLAPPGQEAAEQQQQRATTVATTAKERDESRPREETLEAMRRRLGPALDRARRTRSGNR
jgi:hypothetical protein